MIEKVIVVQMDGVMDVHDRVNVLSSNISM